MPPIPGIAPKPGVAPKFGIAPGKPNPGIPCIPGIALGDPAMRPLRIISFQAVQY
ncbi:hypothetical protein [Solilutibacter silvestris]|uniref:hypothetical protein n=1 Tax=Solilutibacter silvestris TaxID=1645665 RepID=UPI0013FDEF85|nr:hypothetical protein [Lysobacter silvestris]